MTPAAARARAADLGLEGEDADDYVRQMASDAKEESPKKDAPPPPRQDRPSYARLAPKVEKAPPPAAVVVEPQQSIPEPAPSTYFRLVPEVIQNEELGESRNPYTPPKPPKDTMLTRAREVVDRPYLAPLSQAPADIAYVVRGKPEAKPTPVADAFKALSPDERAAVGYIVGEFDTTEREVYDRYISKGPAGVATMMKLAEGQRKRKAQ